MQHMKHELADAIQQQKYRKEDPMYDEIKGKHLICLFG